MRLLAPALAALAGAAFVLPHHAAAQGVTTACGRALTVEPDLASFEMSQNEGDPAAQSREAAARFADAATRLCGTPVLRAADLARFSRLLVASTDGALEPVVYDDAEQGPDTIILEYAFPDGAAPGEEAIATAIRCWRQPETAGCDQGE